MKYNEGNGAGAGAGYGMNYFKINTARLWVVSTTFFCLTMTLAGADRAVRGDAPPAKENVDPQVAEFFETKVRPVLANNCYGCHGPASQMAGLRLDSKAFVLKGGDSGPVIVANDPAKSPLIQVVHHTGKIQMPPGGKLKPEEIAALEEWVKLGAPWPGAEVSKAALAAAQTGEYTITPEQRRFWSFQPVRQPPLPPVKNTAWAAVSPIDRFVLAKLEARGLAPSRPADRRTLIRRATFDLHGLPPTPAEVAAFVNDKSPDAFAKVVDRLLISPRYGERWGRHWLDVARYADTKGYVFTEDRNYPHAYNYRDWVIRAFNEDLPYNQFILQQLAADRLPLGDDKRPLAALGFLRVGRRFLNNPHDIIDDRIDVTMRGFQGLTTSCARCHDHKFDPISTKDYYALYGVFASSIEPEPVPISPKAVSEPFTAHDNKVREMEREEQALVMAQVGLLRERVEKKEALSDAVVQTLQQARTNERPNAAQLTVLEPQFAPEAREKLKTLRESLARLRDSYPPRPEMAMTVADAPQPMTPRVFRRGNPGNPGDEVPRRFHTILWRGRTPPAWTQGSGRLELARAIASRNNPLTARVLVNRVWLHHFGSGLVRTPSDFGKQGERPTHPELLDYLAWRFMENGWSIKKLHRSLMLSRTYQQSSEENPANFNKDPENRLVWRMNRRRLELEALRDSLLAASGRLDLKPGGPSIDIWNTPFPPRRTVYGFIERQNLPGIFRTFDFASPDATSAQRFRTTVPQQALFLMNSPFVVEQARLLITRPELIAKRRETHQIKYLYRLLYGREPEPEEVALGLRYLQSAAAPSTPAAPKANVWQYGYGAYDDATKRVISFTPLPFFKDNGYQGGEQFPSPLLRFLRLTPTGGHPGRDARHAAIRRWIAPQNGVVSIRATLGHGHVGKGGDGVEARIVSSRTGLLGTWIAQDAKQETLADKVTVKKGDAIDFVVSCRANDSFDSFIWSPNIALAGGKVSWNANSQFRGRDDAVRVEPLSAWERYAQALLMTNEFIFVD